MRFDHTMIDMESADGVLRGLVINMELFLTSGDVKYIWESIDAGEWVIAFEDLCTQLDEREAKISQQDYDDIGKLGEYFGMSPSDWDFLAPDRR